MTKYIVKQENTNEQYEEILNKRFDTLEQAREYGLNNIVADLPHGLTDKFAIYKRTIDIEKFTCDEKCVYYTWNNFFSGERQEKYYEN